MKRVLISLLVALWIISIAALPASAAVEEPPHAFFGAVTINGAPAPVGTRIEARGAGVLTGIAGNPITTTQSGLYGGQAVFDPKLVVQGAIAQGAPLSFFVNGNAANETAIWSSGQVTLLNLTVTAGGGGVVVGGGGGGGGGGNIGGGGGGGAGGGGGGGAGTGSSTVTLSGMSGTTPTLDNSGKTTATAKLNTDDNKVVINIATGTQMIDKAGMPVTTFTAAPLLTPPAPPPQGSIVLAYEFGPTGAKFNPPISMTLSFNPTTVPAGMRVDKLSIAWWDVASSKWQKLASTLDPATNTITAQVSHFTDFAIIAEPEPVPAPTLPLASEPIAPPVSTPSLATVPGPQPSGQTTPAPSPTPAPIPEQTPSVSPAPVAPAPQAQTGAPNFGLIGGTVAAAVLMIGLLILVWRKQSS